MTTASVVVVARGLRVAQRGAPAGAASDLHVVDVAPLQLPETGAFEAYNVDHDLWRRSWSLPDRLVIEFLGVAAVEVRDDGAVVFDRTLVADLEQHLLLDHVLPLVLARRGAVVLHGAVLSREGCAVVLVGPSGAGKSTLTAYAWQQGWTVGGDDGAVLATAPLTVEPTYSTVRLTAAASQLLGLTLDPDTQVVGKRRLQGLDEGSFQQVPVRLTTVAFLEPGAPDDARFVRVRGAAAHALMFGSTFHLGLSGGDHLRNAVQELGLVAEQAVVGRLVVPRGLTGLAAAEQLLREQAGP